MPAERCTPGRHVGEDMEGRCSVCGDRLEGRSGTSVGCLLILLSLALLGLVALVAWWLAG